MMRILYLIYMYIPRIGRGPFPHFALALRDIGIPLIREERGSLRYSKRSDAVGRAGRVRAPGRAVLEFL